MQLVQIVIHPKRSSKSHSFLVETNLLKHSYDDCINKCLEALALKRSETSCIATQGIASIDNLGHPMYTLFDMDVYNYTFIKYVN